MPALELYFILRRWLGNDLRSISSIFNSKTHPFQNSDHENEVRSCDRNAGEWESRVATMSPPVPAVSLGWMRFMNERMWCEDGLSRIPYDF